MNIFRSTLTLVIPLAIPIAMTACGGDDDPAVDNTNTANNNMTTPQAQPIDYYEGALSAALGAEGNEADCALCHSNDGSSNGTNGDSLMNIFYKASWKGGGQDTLLGGANACVTGWMGGTALTEQDEEWMMLSTYLESISSETSTTPNAITPEVLENEAAYEAEYAGGDSASGEATYNNYCGRCHTGALQLGQTPSFPLSSLAARSIGRIAQKVRTSGPPPSGTADASDTTPGPMPFFEPDELTTEDLRNIIAYIKAQQ